jgi:Zn-dependent peptidase ImmA (M78 family)/DNA-binding XRE family transcriptional regulator
MNYNSNVAVFDGKRLRNRRYRKGLTKKALAEDSRINQRLITDFETGRVLPTDEQMMRLIVALQTTREYLTLPWNNGFSEPALSFRAPSKMSQRNKNAAMSIAQDGMDLCEWILKRYDCPPVNIPNFSYADNPEQASDMIRAQWGLGQQPIGNMVTLLESHGVFVFAAETENDLDFDAFSYISDHKPFVCLGTRKTPERDRFDLAHELGHLVLHQEDSSPAGRNKEQEANAFASALLMPKGDTLAQTPSNPSTEAIKKLKNRWGVAATALTYRLHQLGVMTDWTYHSALIQLTKEGYRISEPNGILVGEKSAILDTVFRDLYQTHSMGVLQTDIGQTKQDIAEIVYGLTLTVSASNRSTTWNSKCTEHSLQSEMPKLSLHTGGLQSE